MSNGTINYLQSHLLNQVKIICISTRHKSTRQPVTSLSHLINSEQQTGRKNNLNINSYFTSFSHIQFYPFIQLSPHIISPAKILYRTCHPRIIFIFHKVIDEVTGFAFHHPIIETDMFNYCFKLIPTILKYISSPLS